MLYPSLISLVLREGNDDDDDDTYYVCEDCGADSYKGGTCRACGGTFVATAGG